MTRVDGLPRSHARAVPFIGRAEELAELADALAGTRLLLLSGPAGVGKTRLAHELAAGARSRRSGGVHVVELAPITDPGLVPQAVAGAFSIWQQPGHSLTDSLVAGLRRRRALLTLDNCEHLATACSELVATLLDACPELSIVATSQVRLGVPGELVWQVTPLSLPDESLSEESLSGSEAVRLFCARAEAVQPGFSARGARLSAIGEICRHLDGLPLAIELAAALVKVVTPAQLAARLGERFAILMAGDGSAGDRHGTLRGAVDWSHNLLSPEEQAVLRRLAVFAGSASRSAALEACSAGLEALQVEAALAGLVDRSLLMVDSAGEEVRYSLLETIRLYAAERLGEAGEGELVKARHAHWCGRLAEAAEPGMVGPDQAAWFERLETDKENCRAALSWMLANEQAEPALRLASALIMFWRIRGYFREGRDWLEAALGKGEAVDERLRAKALWGVGFLSIMLSDDETGPRALERALDIARGAGDSSIEARCLMLIGNHLMFVKRDRAVPLLEESITVARSCGDRWCLGHALALLGKTHVEVGNPREGRRAFEECLSMARQDSDAQSLKIGLACFGDAAVLWGEYTEAETLLHEAIAVSTQLGDPYTVAVATSSLGEVALYRGQYEKALRLLQRGLAGANDTGNPASAMATLCLVGAVYQALGNHSSARRSFTDAVNTAIAIGRRCAPALGGLGAVARVERQWSSAADLMGEALFVASASRSQRASAPILLELGRLARAQGEVRGAMSRYQEALRGLVMLGAQGMTIEALEAVAELLAESGPVDRAATLLAAVDQLRRARGHVRAPSRRAAYDHARATVRRQAGEKAHADLCSAGAAMSLAEAVAYAMRPVGTKLRPRTGWASLSQTEQNVARLAADGLTNREIGERLFISPRTAETHLTHVFAKLEIRRRHDLVRALDGR